VLALERAIQSAVPQQGFAPWTSGVVIENAKAGGIGSNCTHLTLIGTTAQKETLGRLADVSKTELRKAGSAVLASGEI
jgi:hypothetical protein